MGVVGLSRALADAQRRATTDHIHDRPCVHVRAADPDPATPPLVVVPGLNDPLLRVTGTPWYAALMALFARRYAASRDVYVVSRPLDTPETTRELAHGYVPVLDALGPADVLGLSMGGFLVQHLAADHPGLVERAVLGLAAASLSEHGREVVARWRDWGQDGDWARVYREAYDAVATGPLRRLLRFGGAGYARLAPGAESPVDFARAADACLAHDATDRLDDVAVPTLVVGGTADPFFDEADFRATAAGIPDADLAVLSGLGHEAVLCHPRTFDAQLARFFDRTR
jgi:pimeloyl-ACP methyl ester carboxylesterase